MRLKIVSSGHGNDTNVVNAETGEPLELVQQIEWSVTANRLATAKITLLKVPVELDTHAEAVEKSIEG